MATTLWVTWAATATAIPLFPGQSLTTGNHPIAPVLGDLNGDGQLDLVVANSASNSLSVFISNGDGSFKPRADLVSGVQPDSVAIADLNGDGKPDLAATNRTSASLSIWLGSGTGTFGVRSDTTTPAAPIAVAARDFNHDGKNDLAVASATTSVVSVYLGNGNGTLQPPQTYGTAATPLQMETFDANADGAPDLAVVTSASIVSVLINNGNGTFAARLDTATLGLAAAGLATADFNGDGRADLVVSAGTSTVELYLGNGTGTFTPQAVSGAGSVGGGILAADVNGDGRADLLLNSSDRVSVSLGNGNATFQTRVTTLDPFIVTDMAVAELTGDAKPDLVVTNGSVASTMVLAGNGNGTFQTKIDYPTGSAPQAVATGDLNGDGAVDAVVANNASNTVSVLLGNGNGTLQAKVDYATGAGPRSVVLADVNGDNKLDVLTPNATANTVSVLLGNGNGTFAPRIDIAAGTQPLSLAVGQFTAGDQALDIAVTNQTGGTVSVLIGHGDGTFSPAATITPPGNSPHSVASADFDGDGRSDLAVAHFNAGGLSIYLSNGNGTFRVAGEIAYSGVGPQNVVVGDLNGDNRADLIVTNGASTVSVYLGLGTGAFAGRVDYATGAGSNGVAIGDVNGDGKADLAVTNLTSGTVSVLIGNGDGTFQSKIDYLAGLNPVAVAIADMNADSNSDVLVVNSSALSLLLNVLYPPPTIVGGRTPAPNAAGWNNTPVTVTWSCASAHLASCTSPTTLSANQAGQTISGTSIDEVGRSTTTTVGPINIDQVAPTVIGVPTSAPNTAGWYRGDVTIGWTCVDNLSGIAPGACPPPATITGEGLLLTASASVVDRADNLTNALSQAVKIDRTPPVTAASAAPTWNNTDITIALNATDNLSTVDTTFYTLDGEATPHQGTTVMISQEGVHTLRFWSRDVAGNVETANQVTVQIDKTSPTISDAETPGANANGWNNTPVSVHFICTDALSGVATCTPDTAVSTDGTAQLVTGTALDNAGNSATDPVRINIDRVAPAIVAIASPASGHWTNGPVQVNFQCADDRSGITSCPPAQTIAGEGANQTATGSTLDAAGNSAQATITGIDIDLTLPLLSPAVVDSTTHLPVAANPAGWYSTPITVHWTCSDALSGLTSAGCPADTPVTSDGEQTIAASVSDVAGNTTSATVTVRLDRGNPEITAEATPGANINGWNNTDVTVGFTCTDGTSGIAPSGCPMPVVLHEGAGQSATGTATDVAGNTSTTTRSGINIDLTPPTLVGTARTSPNAAGWYNSDVTIDWTCADHGTAPSGVDGPCPASVTITGEGLSQSDSESIKDRAGNESPAVSTPVNIDTTPPITAASAVPNWSNAAVAIELTPIDALSGVASTFYTVAPGGPGHTPGPVQSGSSVSFATAGIYELAYWSVDNAGNVEAAHTVTVKIDTTAPTIVHALSPVANAAGWNNDNVIVTFTCGDSLSGVASCTAPVSVTTEGAQQSVIGTAIDNASNTANDTALVSIDRTPPTLSASSSSDPGTWSALPVTVTFSCDDPLSGIALCPPSQTVSGDGANQSVSGTARDTAGNVTTTTVNGIGIDTVPPTITAELRDLDGSPVTANTAGWFAQPVVVHWTCADALSGVAAGTGACPADHVVNADGSTTVQGSVSDLAGNHASGTQTVRVDSAAPTITPIVSPSANTNGWNNTAVTVAFECADTVSGIALSGGCSAPTLLSEGIGQTVHGTATDAAGNSSSVDVANVNVDLTAPTIHGTPTTASTGGWYDNPVVVHWTCTDSLSGFAPGACPADTAITGEGAAQSQTASVTDLAGNTATGTSTPVGIDLTPPQTSASDPVYGPDPNSAIVTLQAVDALSGVAATTYSIDDGPPTTGTTITVTGPGTRIVHYYSTDAAGNIEPVNTMQVEFSSSGPTIVHSVAPAPNDAGWNNTNVTVTFTCTPGSHTVVSCSGPRTLSTEGAAQNVTGEAIDSAGQHVTDSAIVNIDKTTPTITASVGGTVHNGWHPAPTEVSFTCTDDLSGIAIGGCPSPVTLGAGANQSVTRQATDNAGNTSSVTIAGINVDPVAPTIIGTITTPSNAAGWYRADVVVHWTCLDTLSGISSGACPHDTVVHGEGTTLTASATVTDQAGNIAIGSVTGIHIDRTAPSITVTTTSTGAYNRSAVTVHFACSDALSGIATCPADVRLSTDGLNQVVTGTARDVAGNSSTTTTPRINIDQTPPVVRVTGVTQGATYTLRAANPGCDSSDAISGIASSAVLSLNGATPNGVGTIVATCSGALDRAGNTAQASVTYSVRYAFTGFFSPLANPPTVTTAEAHSVVPIRFALADSHGRSITSTSAIVSITAQAVTSYSPADPALATPVSAVDGTSLGYRSSTQQFLLWWVTPSQVGKYVVFVTLDDGTVHQANVNLSGVHRLDDDFKAHCSLRDDD